MFVVVLRYVKPIAEVERFLQDHRRWLASQYEAGHLLLSGPRRPRVGGVLLAEATTSEAMWTILKSDPFYRAGVAEYDVVDFQPTMAARGLRAIVDPRGETGANPPNENVPLFRVRGGDR